MVLDDRMNYGYECRRARRERDRPIILKKCPTCAALCEPEVIRNDRCPVCPFQLPDSKKEQGI